jgi:hypothetical protein
MVRPDILVKLVRTNAGLTSHRSNPAKKFFIYKIFLELGKYIRLIFRYKKNTSLNEFSSSIGNYKTRRISWDILKPFSYCC